MLTRKEGDLNKFLTAIGKYRDGIRDGRWVLARLNPTLECWYELNYILNLLTIFDNIRNALRSEIYSKRPGARMQLEETSNIEFAYWREATLDLLSKTKSLKID